jgi:hypothetical protein
MPLPLIPQHRPKQIPLLKKVLIMETLRNMSPRPLSPYSDDPQSRSSNKSRSEDTQISYNLITIGVGDEEAEAENPFSDSHEIKSRERSTTRRSSSWKLPLCINWSFFGLVDEVKALVGVGRGGRLGLKSLDGKQWTFLSLCRSNMN